MRVAFLTHEPYWPPSGGGSAEAPHLVREFRRRGHRVDLFCPVFPDMEQTAETEGIRVHGFSGWAMGRYTAFRNAKYLLYPMALSRMVQREVARARAAGEEGAGYDLLFAQHTISAVAAGMARRRVGGRLVFNFLDYLTGFMEAWPAAFTRTGFVPALKRFEMAMPARFGADGILTVSEPLADRFVAAGYPRERTRALLYGYDSRVFRPNGANPKEPPVVVMHGSFDRHHLGPIALEAVVRVHGRRPDVRWRFVGRETPQLKQFLEVLRHRCPGVSLECPGFVPYAEMAAWLQDATVGMVPYEETEGGHCAFVAKAVEYLACGLPVVSTPLENLTRYFAGEPAIRFSQFDGESFARCIEAWLETSVEKRRATGAAAAAAVAKELDWERLGSRAVDFAEQEVLANPGRKGLVR